MSPSIFNMAQPFSSFRTSNVKHQFLQYKQVLKVIGIYLYNVEHMIKSQNNLRIHWS